MKKFLAIGLLAISSMLAVPAMAASLAAVNLTMIYHVLVNDYNIEQTDVKGIKVIERRDDGTVVVQVTTQTQAYTISYRNGESVNRDGNPCYATHGGFHRAVAVGGGHACVYDPDMYVSKINETQPAYRVDDVDKDVCNITTKTRTHSGGFFGYGIDTDNTVEDGTCN